MSLLFSRIKIIYATDIHNYNCYCDYTMEKYLKEADPKPNVN